MTPHDAMQAIDIQLSHIWMVRTFIKHSPEAEEDEELREVARGLYDYSLSLGAPWQAQDAATYLRTADKKFAKLRRAVELFEEIQPEVSTHTNFLMARASLATATRTIRELLDAVAAHRSPADSDDGSSRPT